MGIPASLRDRATFSRPRLYFFEQSLTAEQAERYLASHQTVTVNTGHGVERLDDLQDATTLGALESGAPEVLAARTLATGLLETDGIFDGDRKLSAFQAIKQLSRPIPSQRLTVRCALGDGTAGSADDLNQIYQRALRSAPIPIARFHNGGEVGFQPAGPQHLGTLFALHQMAFFDHPWPLEWFAPYTANPASDMTVANGPDGAVGFSILGPPRIYNDGGTVDFVAVAPQAQGKKVGDQLMLHLFEQARSRGYNRLYLEVNTRKAGAQHLYEKCGFHTIEHRTDYYAPGQDAFIMRMDDVCGAGGEAAMQRLQRNFSGR